MEKKLQSLPKNQNKLEESLEGDLKTKSLDKDLNTTNSKLPESTEKRVENILLYAKCQLIVDNLFKETAYLYN